ncbi:PLD nuclease N-terminal domain-containing protein [Oerskovia enterophila]|uniref:PLD nuclease N-terminal domain-containing protein n=1 Tax=Oerskovia enterophila TaxID=43678 RepID=UPI003814498E
MSRVLLTLLAVGLAVYALSDCATSDEHDRSGIPKGLWIVMIIFLPFVGPLAWILVSRTQRSRHAAAGGVGSPRRPGAGGSRRRSSGPVAPDDDPDFLWKLEQQRRREARDDGSASGSATASGTAPGHAPRAAEDEREQEPRSPGKGSTGETDSAPDAPSSGSNDPS